MNHLRTITHESDDQRGGVALIVAIVCLTLTTAMTVSLVRLALASHRQAEREHWRVQSVWLAESGLSRAAVQLRADDEYTGEEWTLGDIGAAKQDAHVVIQVAADPQDESRLIVTATADFPADPTDRVRTTRTLTLSRRSEPSASPSSED